MFKFNTIKNKLILISVLIFAGLSGMLWLEYRISESISHLDHMELQVFKIQIGMLSLRRNEKDFLLRLDPKYQQQFNDQYQQIDKQLNSLSDNLQNRNINADKAGQLKGILHEYQQLFNQLVKQQTILGLSHNSGLYGELRNAVHGAEAKINQLHNNQLLVDMLMLRRHEKDFMLRYLSKYVDKFEQGFSRFNQDLQHSNLTAAEKNQISTLMATYRSKFMDFVDSKKTIGLNEKQGTQGLVRNKVHQTEQFIDGLTNDLEQQINDSRSSANIQFIVVAVLIILIVIVIVMLLSASISKPVGYLADLMTRISRSKDLTLRYDYKGVEEINQVGQSLNTMLNSFDSSLQEVAESTLLLTSSSEELSRITASTRDDVQRQQQETESVATAMNEMTSTVQDVSRSASEAASSSEQADQQSNSGRQLVSDAVAYIRQLADQVVTTSSEMDLLQKEMDNIHTVLQVIGDIAEQTNLLALNAAIEAARAGEQGRGFAVVADEVRTLASRSQTSTQQIRDIIERLQNKTSSAVNVMRSGTELATSCVEKAEVAGQALDQITQAVSAISERNFQIASAAEQQNSVADDINRNIININDIAGQTTEAARQTLQTSDNLASLADNLKQIVSQFKLSR